MATSKNMLSQIEFVKMHGAGNDFIVMDARDHDFPLNRVLENTSRLCQRRTGVGADGILLLCPSDSSDFTMQYLNADGSEAGMCGNGARCLARFARDIGLPANLTFHTNGLLYRAEVFEHYVSVHFPVKPVPSRMVIEGETWYALNTGTEHVVGIDPKYLESPDRLFREVGRRIRNRIDLFPTGTNVNFASILEQNRLRLVTYERGVEDLTLACGTGAIATAITRSHIGDLEGATETDTMSREHHVQIECPGGPLEVSFTASRDGARSVYQNIVLHGPAVTVFSGRITL
jgi:diaminopimelate epimerase